MRYYWYVGEFLAWFDSATSAMVSMLWITVSSHKVSTSQCIFSSVQLHVNEQPAFCSAVSDFDCSASHTSNVPTILICDVVIICPGMPAKHAPGLHPRKPKKTAVCHSAALAPAANDSPLVSVGRLRQSRNLPNEDLPQGSARSEIQNLKQCRAACGVPSQQGRLENSWTWT